MSGDIFCKEAPVDAFYVKVCTTAANELRTAKIKSKYKDGILPNAVLFHLCTYILLLTDMFYFL